METPTAPTPPYTNPLRLFSRGNRPRRYDWEALIAHGSMVVSLRSRSYKEVSNVFRYAARYQGLRVSLQPYKGGILATLVGRIDPNAKGLKSPRFRAEIAAQEAAVKLAP